MVQEPNPSRIAATTLTEDDCNRILAQLILGRSADNSGARFRELHDEIKARDNHFHNTPAAAPKFGAPFENAATYQTDVIRRHYSRGRARVLEHRPRFHVTPAKDTQAWRDAASALEDYFTDGLRQVEERNGYRLQGHMYHGQALHYGGWLHWRMWTEQWPAPPDDIEYPDAADVPGEASRTDAGTYRETAQSRLDRYRRMKADAPFPWLIDSPRCDAVAFVEDRSLAGGMGIFVRQEKIGFLAYRDSLASSDRIRISLNQADNRVKVYAEAEAPTGDDPSAGTNAWGDVVVSQLSLRNECYELVSSGNGHATLVKSFKTPYGMPPATFARAMETNHPDPLYRWQPWLLGLFRTKPQYDYERSLGRLLAEQTAMPRYWVELASGEYLLDARGNRMVLSSDAAVAQVLPSGAKLVRAELEFNPAFIQFLSASKTDIEEATPETGFVEVGTNTAPHTLVMAQAQSNTEIADLKFEQARALRICFQNILQTMAKRAEDGGLGESIVIKRKDGTLVEITPEMARGMTVEVAIEPNSGAQQIARNEYLRGLLADPKAMMTVRKYLEETGEENPDRAIESAIAEQAEFAMIPQVVQQELAKAYGDAYVITPGGSFVDMQGRAADPMSVLGANGVKRAAPPAPAAAPLPPTMAPLAPLDNAPPAAGAVMPQ